MTLRFWVSAMGDMVYWDPTRNSDQAEARMGTDATQPKNDTDLLLTSPTTSGKLSLYVSFIFCKMGMLIIPTSQGCYVDEIS